MKPGMMILLAFGSWPLADPDIFKIIPSSSMVTVPFLMGGDEIGKIYSAEKVGTMRR